MTTASTASLAPTRPDVRVDGVCVHFGSFVALAPSSFALTPGTTLALVGANGSGKTTLLSVIAGLLPPTDGTVSVAGSVALVTQHHQHHQWMPLSVEEVLRMGRYRDRGLLGRLRRSDRELIDVAAAELEVDRLRQRPFGELSGGQRQRVLVAQALAADPDVLLLDEPITGLDFPSQLRILEVIDRSADDGRIVVFSTHHLAEARRANRVMLMAGCVLADGDADTVLVPNLLAEAFGGRVVRDDGSTVVVDDHGHVDHDHEPHELGPHHEFHEHEHAHHEHRDHGHARRRDGVLDREHGVAGGSKREPEVIDDH